MIAPLILSIALLSQAVGDVKSDSSHDKEIRPAPQVTGYMPQIHPQEKMSRKTEGKVYLQIFVDTLGYVTNVRIDSSDFEAHRQQAINGVLGIRFTRSFLEESQTATWLPLIVTFDATQDSTKKTNYKATMIRPPGDAVALDKVPTLAKVAAPSYPQEALAKKIEARVVVEVLIDKNGKAKDALVVESGNTIFNESALEVVGRFQFIPGIRNGLPVSAWVGIPIQFTLPKKM